MARRLEAANLPVWDKLLASPLTRPASISSAGTGSPATTKTLPLRSHSSSTTAPARSAVSARTAYKIPGALLALDPQPSKVAVSSRSAYKVPGALLNPPPDDMPFNSKKAGKALGKALGKPFTVMYAAGGEFPAIIGTPADARMQAYCEPQERSGKQREKEKSEEKDDATKDRVPTSEAAVQPAPSKSEKDTPAQVVRAPQYPQVPLPSERHNSPLLSAQRPRLDSRPESGLLPQPSVTPSVGYRDEKHAPVTSPALVPVEASSHPGRSPDFSLGGSKNSSGPPPRSLDDTEDHIRQLFNALPPEAQALAYARLAEQRERETQLAVKREHAMMWEREAEARIEWELREKERARIERETAHKREQDRHYHHFGPNRDHYDAYDSASLSGPASRPTRPGHRQLSGDASPLERQASTLRRVPVGPRQRFSPQEEVEGQIAQLLEAQMLPPRPAGVPSRHTSLRGRSTASPTGLSYDVPPRTLSDPAVPDSFVPPRPVHALPHVQPSPRARLSESPGPPPDMPGSSFDLVGSTSQMSTPRSKAAGGDSEVRAALAAKIQALQAALDTLDVDHDDDVSEIVGADRPPTFSGGDFDSFPSPPTQAPSIAREAQWRSGSPEGPLRRPAHTPTSGWMPCVPEDLLPRAGAAEDFLPRMGGTREDLYARSATWTKSISGSRTAPQGTPRQHDTSRPRAVAPHDVLQLDDFPAPHPRVANVSPHTMRRQLPLEEEPCSRPSSDFGGDHFILDSYDRRGFRQTPPPEYATVGPYLSVRPRPPTIDTTALF